MAYSLNFSQLLALFRAVVSPPPPPCFCGRARHAASATMMGRNPLTNAAAGGALLRYQALTQRVLAKRPLLGTSAAASIHAGAAGQGGGRFKPSLVAVAAAASGFGGFFCLNQHSNNLFRPVVSASSNMATAAGDDKLCKVKHIP